MQDWTVNTIGREEFLRLEVVLTVKIDPPRPFTDGLAIHHTATHATDGAMQSEINLIRSIENYHLSLGYPCFGYNAIAFVSGRVYIMGKCLGQRAHVGGQNHRYAGIVMAGNYSIEPPPEALQQGVARWIKAMWAEYGEKPVEPHSVITAGTQWATSCPGDAGRAALPQILQLAKEDDMDQAAFNAMLREAIGLPGGYQDVIGEYLNTLNARIIALEEETGTDDDIFTTEIADIRARLKAISVAAGGDK